MAGADQDWMQSFPTLARCGDDTVQRMLAGAQRITLPADSWVFRAGAPCSRYLLATAGSIRVQLTGATGREVTLYRVISGHSCILTTACLLSSEDYPAEARTESAVMALAIDKGAFQSAVERSPDFCRFVFQSFSQRLADVIRRMEEVMFAPIDARLAGCVLAALRRGALASTTHQDLAVELGTAREVVSRHLKRFEAQGLLHLGRGHIEVLVPEELERLSVAR
jgi:CRP/FNR family transcriptional regulator, anaerobic regulatory protein